MGMIKEYVNQDGYRIRATEKAYHLYYKKQGFKPVTDQQAAASTSKEAEVIPPDASDQDESGTADDTDKPGTDDVDITVMDADGLRAYLIERGVNVKANSSRKHLLELAAQLSGGATEQE